MSSVHPHIVSTWGMDASYSFGGARYNWLDNSSSNHFERSGVVWLTCHFLFNPVCPHLDAMDLETLFSCSTVDDVATWLAARAHADLAATLASGTADDRSAFRSRLLTLRRALHPLTNLAPYNALLERFRASASDEERRDLGRQVVRVQREVDEAPFLKTFGVLDAVLAEVGGRSPGRPRSHHRCDGIDGVCLVHVACIPVSAASPGC